MKIISITPQHFPKWDAYVLSHKKGTFFHLTSWKKVIEDSFGHKSFYYAAIDDRDNNSRHANPSWDDSAAVGNIVGILPLFSAKSRLFGNYMVSIPFAAYGGICADSELIEEELRKKAIELTCAEGLDYLELRGFDSPLDKECVSGGLDLSSSDNNKCTAHGSLESSGMIKRTVKTLYVTFIKEISSNPEANFEALPRKTRRMVRQGEKFDLEYVMDNNLLDEFYTVFCIGVHQLGTPVLPKSYFKNLMDVLGKDCTISVVRKDKKPIAGVFTFYYKDQILPYYAASVFEYRQYAPNDFMYWNLMSYAAQSGRRIFDYGRSKTGTGNCDFKRHWGFEPTQLYYQYYLNKINTMPDLSPLNPKYKLKIELWRRLPLGLANLIGPHIVKNIP